MKVEIKKFPVHQNAKVFALLMAGTSLLFVVPFVLATGFMGAQGGLASATLMLALPVFYLVIGYLAVAFSCWLYNQIVKVTGGLQFEQNQS